jgi:hypothetical protein
MYSADPSTAEASRYKCLAEAVIIQAIKDATSSTGCKTDYRSSGHMYCLNESAEAANHFLLTDSGMFQFWCEAAGLIPDEVRRRLVRRLKNRRTFHLIRALHRTRERMPNEK